MAENMQKIKLIKLFELLQKETDSDHAMSRTMLCQRLNNMGISSNVRTLSKDIEVLNENGYEILSYLKDKEKYFYVPEHEFSLPEIRILMDAVEAASFITPKKTREIVEKVALLGGSHSAELMKKHSACFNTRKHTNEQILFSVDSLVEAINRQKKAAFFYFDLDEKGERVYRCKTDGEKKRYYVEPVALVFNEDNYYLMTYSNRHPDTTANYRVDRMEQVEVVEDSTISLEALAKLEGVADYTEQVFKMYNGDAVGVVIQFDRCLIGAVYDKFGEDTPMMKVDENTCAATVQVRVSPTFFGWVAQFADKMRIISPDNVIAEYREHINKIIGGSDNG